MQIIMLLNSRLLLLQLFKKRKKVKKNYRIKNDKLVKTVS